MKLVTFTADTTQAHTFQTTGTARVLYQGAEVELPATVRHLTVGTSSWNETTVRGFAARYETGSKLWKATVRFNDAGKMTGVDAGLENRVRRNTARVVGLWADVAESDESRHAGA